MVAAGNHPQTGSRIVRLQARAAPRSWWQSPPVAARNASPSKRLSDASATVRSTACGRRRAASLSVNITTEVPGLPHQGPLGSKVLSTQRESGYPYYRAVSPEPVQDHVRVSPATPREPRAPRADGRNTGAELTATMEVTMTTADADPTTTVALLPLIRNKNRLPPGKT